MNIAFRVDASSLMGVGHVMRCLVLADGLRVLGNQVMFICRMYPGNSINYIKNKGFIVHELPFVYSEVYSRQPFSNNYKKWLWLNQNQDAIDTVNALQQNSVDWLVIDHYSLDLTWERQLKNYVKKIMVIDDLANRKHECDLLLDQNFYFNAEFRYNNLVPANCQKLLGPKYILLREEFSEIRDKRKLLKKSTTHEIKKIMLFMGGADTLNATQKIIDILFSMPNLVDYSIDIVIGENNSFKDKIKSYIENKQFFNYHVQPSYYNELLINADLVIGSGGSSVWERCYIGLPSIIFSIAENQILVCESAHQYGAHIYLGALTKKSLNKLNTTITNLSSDDCKKLIDNGLQLVDGLGIKRLINYLCT